MKTSNRIATTCFLLIVMFSCTGFAQQSQDWLLDKMPADLEMTYALSSLPPQLRDHATVYLLDPRKGYYIARQGTNGFSAYVNRTIWERGEFDHDHYAALGFDSAGANTLLKVFLEVGNMRASGKYTATQIRDIVIKRVKDGIYKAPPRNGICYMLSPLLRTYNDKEMVNMVMPHYMFYAPGVDDSDIGGGWTPGGHHPFIGSTGDVLDKSHSIFNYIILAAGETEKAKIVEENKNLLRRLGEYKAILKVDGAIAEHHH